ncbi:DUF1566 domain-containing protein [Alkalimonas collagenimarina]|uniref:DUF1566 domain-containing protein n=1 Tax=Alkalimonas collagenimarina TaxID=400390 RepID=A0ABT9GU83_9GAMM|nr:DUF1566 domain-containing protein [Alkalimonas collagenimarina]MDP4534614.1 DUF1566 domain-containing protein [Alkalimonas collagenimarina]
MTIKRFSLLLLLIGLLLGCGGKGEEASALASVNAGADREIIAGGSFTLRAQGDPAGGEYQWRQLSGPALSELPATGAELTIALPTEITDALLMFEVEYRLADGNVLRDRVQVRVIPRVSSPVALIQSSVAPGTSLTTGVPLLLTAEDSFDPEGQSLSYHWQQLAGPMPWLPQPSSAAELVLKAPLLADDANFRFELTVTNTAGLLDSADIEFQVQANANGIYADAGPDRTVQEFARVQLDGRHSATLHGELECHWQQVTGATIDVADPLSCQTNFIVPDSRQEPLIELQLHVRDSRDETDSATLRLTVLSSQLHFQVDTGQDRCFDLIGEIDCENTSFPRQDADFGRDSISPFLNKIGQGRAGFDFSKLDQFGDELPTSATVFSCLRDNVTGLIWELKQPAAPGVATAELRSASNSYSWTLNEDGNGEQPGEAAAALSSCPSSVDCGTEQYIADVNASLYCGGANWRLPTVTELNSLLDFGGETTLDEELFLHEAEPAALGHLYYWTQQSSAEGGGGHSAWVIDMQNGNDNSLPKRSDSRAYIRLVRNP